MKSNHELSIIMLSIEQIAPFQNNPRKHPPKQIAMLESGIRKFGFNCPPSAFNRQISCIK